MDSKNCVDMQSILQSMTEDLVKLGELLEKFRRMKEKTKDPKESEEVYREEEQPWNRLGGDTQEEIIKDQTYKPMVDEQEEEGEATKSSTSFKQHELPCQLNQIPLDNSHWGSETNNNFDVCKIDLLRIFKSNEILWKDHTKIVSTLAIDHTESRVFTSSYGYSIRMYDSQETSIFACPRFLRTIEILLQTELPDNAVDEIQHGVIVVNMDQESNPGKIFPVSPPIAKVPNKFEQFPWEPVFSNSFIPEANQDLWTFFVLEEPHGATGGVVSIDLKSSVAISFEIYARFGSLPTLHNGDYYTNVSYAAKSSIFITLNKRKGQTNMHLNITYPMKGIWCLGVRCFVALSLNVDDHEVTMHVSLLGCPTHYSKHGTCHQSFEESGLIIFSYCSCDQTHGGFDCSMELVTPKGHKRQSMALIVSNVATLLPGLGSIHQKAYFMDFWLSSMAVVATFIYMVAVDENTKVAIYIGVAIITSLIATSGPTRTISIILVAMKREYGEFKVPVRMQKCRRTSTLVTIR
eukprot:Gb_01158 [translate_table: standard]